MIKHLGCLWVDRNEINDDDFEREFKMSLASGILFMIWVSIVMVGIGSWVMMTIIRQEKSIYDDWDNDKDFHDEVG